MPDAEYLYRLVCGHFFDLEWNDSSFHALWCRGLGEEAVARRLGARMDSAVEQTLEQWLRSPNVGLLEQRMWIGTVDDWVWVLPAGWRLLDDEILAGLSRDDGQVLDIIWDISGNYLLTYATDGRILTRFDPCFPREREGVDPHALDHLMAGLRFELADPDDRPPGGEVTVEESLSSAFVLAGRLVGRQIDDEWFSGIHTCYHFKA
ncbi:DUF6461 domain-containing protein [Thermopolyspora sp. NPDC052614]|uniref:DUF6461 domain-containing protein n=1 Tax=Thermopolyspora sp. NPDC052614 TaxID=3155682 RepID=UPI00341F7068